MTSDVSQRSVPEELLFSTFFGNMDSETECTIIRFPDDTKLCGAVKTMEVMEAIQRDLNWLER